MIRSTHARPQDDAAVDAEPGFREASLRDIKKMVDEALEAMSSRFDEM
jgi:hypothetical protein